MAHEPNRFFEPTLSKKRLSTECRSNSGIFFVSSYRVNVTSCNLCAKPKNRTEPFPGKIGRGILNLVALALTVTELFNKVFEKV